MILSDAFELFVKQSPVTVMVRATLENTLSPERLDGLFARTARRQRPSELLFSLVTDLMGTVVCGVRPSMHAAFQARADEIDVSLRALYGKLQGIETQVSRELVRDTAARMASIIDQTGGILPELVPGYRVKLLDGNHLPRSERRLKELRTENVAPLPGHSLVVLDPLRMLAVDVFPCEDGHAQERSLLPQVLETIDPDDLIVADRNFCTTGFLGSIADRDAWFAIRQHNRSLRHELIGRRRKSGISDTGIVYEQIIHILPENDDPWVARRITIKLNEPTRDKATEVHLITNLPEDVDALAIAELYRQRWTIETAFQELQATLEGELQTLAYPEAALFAFCVALVAYNVLSVVKSAMRAVHGVETVRDEVSGYYLADEVSGTWRGMMLVLPDEFWEDKFANHTPKQIARFLVTTAKHIRLSAFKKHPRGRKKKPPVKMNKKHRITVATARVLKKSRTHSRQK